MKFVLNRCAGGFELSSEALYLAIQRGATGIEITPERRFLGDMPLDEELHEYKDGFMLGELRDVFFKHPYVYLFNSTHLRDRLDPVLIDIVYQLGPAASGKSAKLEIIDVPDADYELQEREGFEFVICLDQHKEAICRKVDIMPA